MKLTRILETWDFWDLRLKEMADEKWQKVRETFDSALRRKPEERRKFVHEVCGNDKTLLAEVESLLLSLNSAENFMFPPPPLPKLRMLLKPNKKNSNQADVLGITK